MNRTARYYSGKFLLMGLLLLAMASCSPVKKLIKEPLREQGADYLFDNLKQNELKYDYFSAKFSASVKQNKSKNSFSGQIRIKKDSVIWISISPALGIEMARLLITNDSVKYMNRLDNTYFTGNLEYIETLIHRAFDYDMLQAFLTGNDFSFYENSTFRASIENREYKLVTTERRKLKKYLKQHQEISIPLQSIWLDPETFKISRVQITELNQGGRKLDGSYEYRLAEGQLVPQKLMFTLELHNTKNAIEVDYSKISTGDVLQFPFRIPEKYKPVEKF